MEFKVVFLLGILFAADGRLAIDPVEQSEETENVEVICVKNRAEYCKDKPEGFEFDDGCRKCTCSGSDFQCATEQCVERVSRNLNPETYCVEILEKNLLSLGNGKSTTAIVEHVGETTEKERQENADEDEEDIEVTQLPEELSNPNASNPKSVVKASSMDMLPEHHDSSHLLQAEHGPEGPDHGPMGPMLHGPMGPPLNSPVGPGPMTHGDNHVGMGMSAPHGPLFPNDHHMRGLFNNDKAPSVSAGPLIGREGLELSNEHDETVKEGHPGPQFGGEPHGPMFQGPPMGSPMNPFPINNGLPAHFMEGSPIHRVEHSTEKDVKQIPILENDNVDQLPPGSAEKLIQTVQSKDVLVGAKLSALDRLINIVGNAIAGNKAPIKPQGFDLSKSGQKMANKIKTPGTPGAQMNPLPVELNGSDHSNGLKVPSKPNAGGTDKKNKVKDRWPAIPRGHPGGPPGMGLSMGHPGMNMFGPNHFKRGRPGFGLHGPGPMNWSPDSGNGPRKHGFGGFHGEPFGPHGGPFYGGPHDAGWGPVHPGPHGEPHGPYGPYGPHGPHGQMDQMGFRSKIPKIGPEGLKKTGQTDEVKKNVTKTSNSHGQYQSWGNMDSGKRDRKQTFLLEARILDHPRFHDSHYGGFVKQRFVTGTAGGQDRDEYVPSRHRRTRSDDDGDDYNGEKTAENPGMTNYNDNLVKKNVQGFPQPDKALLWREVQRWKEKMYAVETKLMTCELYRRRIRNALQSQISQAQNVAHVNGGSPLNLFSPLLLMVFWINHWF